MKQTIERTMEREEIKGEDPNKEESAKLSRDLKEKEELAEERLNQLKYLQADFDNYRKKFDKEKENIIKLANENLVNELLVIVDDFERFLRQVKLEEKDREGLFLVKKNFLNILEKFGLKEIETSGKKFDPYYHEALVKEKSDKDDGLILEELQKGFMLKSKVIRPSKVKVAENVNILGGNKNG